MKLKNNRKLTVGGLMLLIVTASGLSLANDDVRTEKENLMKSFPNLKVDGFRESPLKGLYEITAGEQVFYFSPEGYLFFGEIWTKDGKNLTAEMREKVAGERIKNLPLDKALKIGNGPVTSTSCHCARYIPMQKRRPATSCLSRTGRRLFKRFSVDCWTENRSP